jgi:hypothetical protein
MGWSEQFRDPDNPEFFIGPDDCSYDSWHDLILTGLFGFCGCGAPEKVLRYLWRGLKIIRGFQYPERQRDIGVLFGGDEAAEFLMWYELDRVGLTEHGVGVAHAWLTEKGEAVLGDMDRYLEDT